MPDYSPPKPNAQHRFSTRTLLYCAVFAGVQALIYLAVSPMAATLATIFPPAYAAAAAAYSVMVFAARLFIDRHGTATVTAAITGILIAAVSPLGLVVLIPLTAAAAVFDLVLFWTRRAHRHRVLRSLVPAALMSAVTLFVISLPAFSPGHLTPVLLAATLLGRAIGQIGAALLAKAIIASLSRAGVHASVAAPKPNSSGS